MSSGPKHQEMTPHYIQAARRGVVIRTPIESVTHFSYSDKYATAHTVNGEYLLTTSLDVLEEIYGDQATRAHRSVLVMKYAINYLRRDNATGSHSLNLISLALSAQPTRWDVPVSRRGLKAVRQALAERVARATFDPNLFPQVSAMSGKSLKTICIYHANCADGFGAAWVVRKALGSKVEFVPGHYGQQPPDVTGKNVILVDFSYKRDVLEEMGKRANSMIVLDHHKSAAEDLSSLPAFQTGIRQGNAQTDDIAGDCCETELASCHGQNRPAVAACFDMERSGAMLAWDHFFPGQEPPLLLRHIQDRDLWQFQLKGTREILASLFSYPHDFTVWDQLMIADTASLHSDGAAIERKQRKDTQDMVALTQRRLVIGGHDVPVANLPPIMSSDAGHLMSQGEPFAACYWDTTEGRTFSLRSSDNGLDVAAIAQQYGGGGHRNAAGFQVPFGHELAAPPAGKAVTP